MTAVVWATQAFVRAGLDRLGRRRSLDAESPCVADVPSKLVVTPVVAVDDCCRSVRGVDVVGRHVWVVSARGGHAVASAGSPSCNPRRHVAVLRA